MHSQERNYIRLCVSLPQPMSVITFVCSRSRWPAMSSPHCSFTTLSTHSSSDRDLQRHRTLSHLSRHRL